MDISFGNTKIGRNTGIFNMNPAKFCPSEKLGFCNLGNKCYAKKAERLYPAALPYRIRQMYYWDRVTAEEFVFDFLLIINRKKTKIKYLRFSESGDFKGQKDVNKMSKIADLLDGIVRCYTYTNRRDLDFSNTSKNLVISGTNFMLDNKFYIITDKSQMIDKYICKGDCKTCNLCKVKGKRNIAVMLH